MKFWICVFIGVWNLSAFGQVDVNAPLENCHIDNKLIVKHGIRSLSVYSEMDEREIDGKSTDSGKLREYEFDENGNVIYKLTASNGGNVPFLFYDKGSRPEYSRYDERGLLVYRCIENLREFTELMYEYDKDEYLTMEQFILKGGGYGDWNYKRTFEWIDGKMVKSVDVNDSEMPGSRIVYDENGRCAEIAYAHSKTTYDYHKLGDTLITTRTDYTDDTLVSTLRFSHILNDKDRVVYNSKKNSQGELLNELIVKYDDFGNITNYQYQESTKEYSESGEVNEFFLTNEVEINNKYDERGFLVKQLFYGSDTYRPEKRLVQVNHFCYETFPLVFKFEKGAISKRALNGQTLNDH